MTEVPAIDPYAHLFQISAADRANLSSKESLELLATLRNTDLVRYEELFATLKANKVPRLRDLEDKVKQVLRHAVDRAKRKSEHREIPSDDFDRDQKSGAILSTQKNIRLAVEKLGITLRYDSFKGVSTIEGLDGFGPAMDDRALNRLWLQVDEEFHFRPQIDFFHTVVSDAGFRNKFHPVRNYLDRLAWDGRPRLDTWLTRYCGVTDTPYTRAVGAIMLIAAVRRIRQPGCKHDEMLVLESPEGFNKSSLLKALAVHDDWFTDSLPLNVDDKRMIENSRGKWIIEISELQGMRRGDVGVIKAQLSRQSDRGRMAYDRMVSEVPRQFICFGTVNPAAASGYLASLTGNRRFWPVMVQRIDLEAFMHDRDQLWAEAAVREAMGESTRLDPELWDAAAAEQRKREAPNPLYDVLLPILGHLEGTIFASDIWTILGIPPERRASHYEKMGAAMKALGWTTRKRRRTRGSKKEGAYARGDTQQLLAVSAGEHGMLSIDPVSLEDAETEETET